MKIKQYVLRHGEDENKVGRGEGKGKGGGEEDEVQGETQ